MITFTREQVKRFSPVAKREIVEALVNGIDEIHAADITTPKRLWAFMATIAVESGGLRLTEENLNYTAARLRKVWPSRFKTLAAAQPYANNPEKLANYVYGKRNGNTKAGDGWAYRGGGLMQTTGRYNYRMAGFEDNPAELRKPGPALTSALKFWSDNNLNRYADKSDLNGLRKAVNGGYNGMEEFRDYYAKAKRIFNDETKEEIPTEDVLSELEIVALQKRMNELGYFVGEEDGDVGPQTVAGISMFQSANGLELTGRFDKRTRERIATASPRIVERANEEPSDSRIVKSGRALKKAAVGIAGVASLDKATDALEQAETASSFYSRVKGLFEPFKEAKRVLFEYVDPQLLVIAVCLIGAFIAYRIVKARIEDHQTGKTI